MFSLGSGLRWLVGLPAAAVGTLLNAAPWWLVGTIAERAAKTQDAVASYKLYGALLLYPAMWLLESAAAALWLPGAIGGSPWGWALATLLLAPATGWLALRHRESADTFGAESRAFLLLATRPRIARTLRQERDAILDRVRSLTSGKVGD
jgi:hypothetical protein